MTGQHVELGDMSVEYDDTAVTVYQVKADGVWHLLRSDYDSELTPEDYLTAFQDRFMDSPKTRRITKRISPTVLVVGKHTYLARAGLLEQPTLAGIERATQARERGTDTP